MVKFPNPDPKLSERAFALGDPEKDSGGEREIRLFRDEIGFLRLVQLHTSFLDAEVSDLPNSIKFKRI